MGASGEGVGGESGREVGTTGGGKTTGADPKVAGEGRLGGSNIAAVEPGEDDVKKGTDSKNVTSADTK